MGNYIERISDKKSKQLTQESLDKIVNCKNAQYITTKIKFTDNEKDKLIKHNLINKTIDLTMSKLQASMTRKGCN